ncbi:DUF6481 family protein [Breoghania sp. L-A4]|uniref:DUF6481 family protein n=1 Tax=Breoghania sp. L-A4 TaxID=2304600 RepID=UPI000E35CAB5|nr:DUF6481 family protein [Breoghania sp. L-A4]AXS39816.1 hypothetical protein D1F64_06810 [Breoghania sp. L-A4]
MKQTIVAGFSDRRKSADEAKQELLKKFKSAPKADDPEMIAKRQEREAVAAAREERQAERLRLKKEKADRLEAEANAVAEAEARAKEEAEAALRAEADEREAAKKKLIQSVVINEEERKAERDRKYAARKARQKR